MSSNTAFDLSKCARPNILALKPYRCARDDYKDNGTNVLLDANENAYGPSLAASKVKGNSVSSNGVTAEGSMEISLNLGGLNRYPDPHQYELKQALCRLRNTHTHTSKTLSPSNLFVGVGSDEAIDALMRCFCRPGHDKIMNCPPTYGMYAVSAQINDVEVVHVPLNVVKNFALNADEVNAKLATDSNIKLVYLCSPGNPTGALLSKEAIQKILEHPTWNGIVVIDEAYVDFSPHGSSLAEWVAEWPNLVVMQTLSKAFGMAGIRLGAAFASPPVARLLNNMKAPYNLSSTTSELAQQALQGPNLKIMEKNKASILAQRDRLVKELPKIRGVGAFKGGFNANYVLVEFLDNSEGTGRPSNEIALQVYEGLAEQLGVVVRFRGKELGCEGCLRITVGTEVEVGKLLTSLKEILQRVYGRSEKPAPLANGEETREQNANAVLA